MNCVINIVYYKSLGKFNNAKKSMEENDIVTSGDNSVGNIAADQAVVNSFKSSKVRPLLVAFKSADQVQAIMQNKSNVESDVIIKLDRTDYQRLLLNEAYKEKKEKEENGGGEFEIKFIKNMPKVVPKSTQKKQKIVSKNSKNMIININP